MGNEYQVAILFGPALLARLREAAGRRGIAAFVRQAVEEKLARRAQANQT